MEIISVPSFPPSYDAPGKNARPFWAAHLWKFSAVRGLAAGAARIAAIAAARIAAIAVARIVAIAAARIVAIAAAGIAAIAPAGAGSTVAAVARGRPSDRAVLVAAAGAGAGAVAGGIAARSADGAGGVGAARIAAGILYKAREDHAAEAAGVTGITHSLCLHKKDVTEHLAP